MKEQLLDIVKAIDEGPKKLNVMREYLQIYALRSIYEKGWFTRIAFVGGTALRFIQGLPRFSEDLYFSLVSKNGYSFAELLSDVKNIFVSSNYSIVIKMDDSKTVNSALLKFPELMHMTGLSHRKEQNLSIKIDVDTKPPSGAVMVQTLTNKYFPITFTHYDLESMFAGKLHAILTRQYVKGRDYFDLIWVLSKWKDIVPNLELLNNALAQTGHKADVTEQNWKLKVSKKIDSVSWATILSDVEKFTENIGFLQAMKPENVKNLLA